MTARIGGHYYTFLALEVADAAFAERAVLFDLARSKRNDFSYDESEVVTETESDELLEEVARFADEVERWISRHAPALARPAKRG